MDTESSLPSSPESPRLAQEIEALREELAHCLDRLSCAEANDLGSPSALAALAIESATDPICVVDAGYVYRLVNRAYAQAYGRPGEDPTGHTVEEVMGREVFNRIRPYLDRCLTGTAVSYERTLHAPEDLPRGHEVNYYPLKTPDGATPYVVVMVHDITERRAMERARGEFISVVSQELEAPLTSLMGSLGALQGGIGDELPAAVRDLVQVAYRNGARLAQLINDILDVERIDSGHLALHAQPLDLMPLVEAALSAQRPQAEGAGVRLLLEYGLPGVQVNADPGRLMQVLASLLSSGSQRCPRDGTVGVRVTRTPGGVRVVIDGRGTAGDPTLTPTAAAGGPAGPRGAGPPGLGIAKGIIERLGGRFSLDCADDQGLTASFELPEWTRRR